MTDPLSELAIRHGTDKFGYHDYTPNYHKLFRTRRNQPVNILEIGVGGYQDEDRGGQSLAMLRDYFPHAQITGIDIQKKSVALGPRVKIMQGSQVDAQFLEHVVATRGPFDIIIDDGSHRNEHVVESFGLLWSNLVAGGIYIIEDVQTSFMPRFGGSLTLESPNTVGMMAHLALQLGQPDALTGDVVAVERFHNIIALHKRGLEAPKGALHAAQYLGGHAIVQIENGDDWRQSFTALPSPGALVISATPERDAPLGKDLFDRFVQVDHQEIAVHFPEVSMDPIAREIYAMERHLDGWLIVKAPNAYPSNFAFDPEQPEAAAAIAAIENVLQDCNEENGLVQFANMLTNIRGRSAARPWLDRLAAQNATSRVYFQLAAGLAQHERRLTDAADLFRSALKQFPKDAGFARSLASILLSQGALKEAEEVATDAVATSSRDSNLWILLARVAAKKGQLDVALTHAERAVDISQPHRKPASLLALAELQIRACQREAAEETLQKVIAEKTRFTAKAYRLLSTIQDNRGEYDVAMESARLAQELAPQVHEYKKWHDSLATKRLS